MTGAPSLRISRFAGVGEERQNGGSYELRKRGDGRQRGEAQASMAARPGRPDIGNSVRPHHGGDDRRLAFDRQRWRNEVRTVLAAALGCNLAWGLVDAVMYLVRTLTERAHDWRLARRVIGAEPEAGLRLIEQSLPSHVVPIIGPGELEGLRQRFLQLKLPVRPMLHRDDFVAAFRVFLLVVFATFPVVLPFLVTDDAALAMEASRVVTLVMLFLAGFSLGRHTWHPHPTQPGHRDDIARVSR
jgi:hypothetical protein